MEDNFSRQVEMANESMKLIFDLTSRIDERTKILIENNAEVKERIERLFEAHTALMNRVVVLENRDTNKNLDEFKTDLNFLEERVDVLSERLIHIEKEVGSQKNRWANIIDFGFKIAQVVIGAIILYKLGIKP